MWLAKSSTVMATLPSEIATPFADVCDSAPQVVPGDGTSLVLCSFYTVTYLFHTQVQHGNTRYLLFLLCYFLFCASTVRYKPSEEALVIVLSVPFSITLHW